MNRLSRWLDSLRRRRVWPQAASCRPRRTFRPGVEALEQREVLATFSVTSLADSGAGSLRQAILDANSNGNPTEVDLIQFDLPAGLDSDFAQTIKVTSALPAVTQSVVIDGYTQKPAHPNSTNQGTEAGLVMQLDGSAAGANADGLVLDADNSVVRGLVINRFGGAGVVVRGSNDVVAGNFIGTNPDGTAARGNGVGVLVAGGAGSRIGSADPADRNLISGNGVGVVVNGAAGTVIQNNFIGVDASGNNALGNESFGIDVAAGAGTLIGGGAPDQGNVISANGRLTLGSGVRVAAAGTKVQGNTIGLRADQDFLITPIVGNGLHGVEVRADDVLVGGGNTGESNVFAYNAAAGVAVIGDVTGVRVAENTFLFNGTLAIDLGGDGPTANDPGDADAGPNGLLNAPVVTSAAVSDTGLVVTGTLSAAPNTAYRIEVFLNPVGVAGGGAGQGIFVSAVVARTDAQGNGAWSFTAPLSSPFPPGFLVLVSADAIDAAGNTSEFSREFKVGDPPLVPPAPPPPAATTADLAVTITDNVGGVTAGGLVTYVVTVTNTGPDAVAGATIATVLPAALTGVTFTSLAANGATGNTAAGSGAVHDTLTLPAGGVVTYVVTGTLAANAAGALTVVAVVGVPAGATDPAPANNSAADTDTIAPAARGVVASLVRVRQKGKTFLRVVVRFADTGEVKAVFRSPFQGPAFQKVAVSTRDTDGDGVADTVALTARTLSGKKMVRLIAV